MFNTITIEDLQAIAGEACNTVAHPQLTSEQLQGLMLAEALMQMGRRDLDPEAKDQAVFNKQLAKELAKAEDRAPQRIVDLFKNTMGQLQLANTSGDNTQFIGAQIRLEMLLGFFNQLAGSMARSAFFHHENAVKAESKAIDLVRQGNAGSYYAGPRVAVVLPETVEEAMDSVVTFLTTLYNAGIGGASQWFKGIHGALEFGGRRDTGTDEWVNFIDYREMWNDLRAFRAEQAAAQAQARSAALGSMLSALQGMAATEHYGTISGDKPKTEVVVKKPRKTVAKPE